MKKNASPAAPRSAGSTPTPQAVAGQGTWLKRWCRSTRRPPACGGWRRRWCWRQMPLVAPLAVLLVAQALAQQLRLQRFPLQAPAALVQHPAPQQREVQLLACHVVPWHILPCNATPVRTRWPIHRRHRRVRRRMRRLLEILRISRWAAVVRRWCHRWGRGVREKFKVSG